MLPSPAEPQPFSPSPSFADLSSWRADPVRRVRGYVGMHVSWGAVAAGAVAQLATSLILWALALGVIALATRPTATSLHESTVALFFFAWICAGLLAAGGSHLVVQSLIRRDGDEPSTTHMTGPMVPTPGQ
jgi:hypothetical protein